MRSAAATTSPYPANVSVMDADQAYQYAREVAQAQYEAGAMKKHDFDMILSRTSLVYGNPMLNEIAQAACLRKIAARVSH